MTCSNVYLIKLQDNGHVSYFGVNRNKVCPHVVCFKEKTSAYKIKSRLMSYKRVHRKFPEIHNNIENVWDIPVSTNHFQDECNIVNIDYDTIQYVLTMNNIPLTMCFHVGPFMIYDDVEMTRIPQTLIVDVLEDSLLLK